MRRLFLFSALVLPASLAFVVAACSSSSSGGNVSATDGSVTGSDGATTSDAGGADAVAASDASPGGPCTFNRDCIASQRCECDEVNGCACADGPRGTGKNGVDTCDSGDDCASSLCADGPGSTQYCSDECADGGGCTGALPVCESIAGIGMICVRQP